MLCGLVVGVWALLSVIGNEHARRLRELEQKYALPPLPQPGPVDAHDNVVTVH